VPFRNAHTIAGEAVRLAMTRNAALADLSVEDYRGLDPRFGEDIHDVLTTEAALASKDVVGGTAPTRVAAEIGRLKEILATFTPDSDASGEADEAVHVE
jgi:argininosuccinate lyase